MEPEAVISLFDSFWYNHEIFMKHRNPSSPPNSDSNPYHKIQEDSPEIMTMCTRGSKMDPLSSDSGFHSDSFSRVSVLPEPLFLSLAVSGKEEAPETQEMSMNHSKIRRSRREAEKGSSVSKSLSELEFQEVKGFMDLGFEFSEEDANSSLVEIIPGLQKPMKGCKKTDICRDDYCKSRPYLSEAWQAMEKDRRKKKALVQWRIPAISNEVDMKDNLRWWACTVASTFR